MLDNDSIALICEKILSGNEEYVKKNQEIMATGQKLSHRLKGEELKLFLDYESKMADLESIIAIIIYKEKAV